MNPIRNWIQLSATVLAVLGLTLTCAGQAFAATYNIILKNSSSTPLSCAVGGFNDPVEFNYNKGATEGSFAPTSPSVTIGADCGIPEFTASTTFNQNPSLGVWVLAKVEKKPGTGCPPPSYCNGDQSKWEDINQGPNVEGLGGLNYPTRPTSGVLETETITTVSNGETIITTYQIVFGYDYVGTPNSPIRTYDINKITQLGIGGLKITENVAKGEYYLRNTANPIPEPETLLLFMAGLAAMGFVARRKRR